MYEETEKFQRQTEADTSITRISNILITGGLCLILALNL